MGLTEKSAVENIIKLKPALTIKRVENGAVDFLNGVMRSRINKNNNQEATILTAIKAYTSIKSASLFVKALSISLIN